jgi:tRNA-specific 2-thiouridylase
MTDQAPQQRAEREQRLDEQRLDEQGRPVTAIALVSGGLDSQLAARVLLEQGVRVVALNFQSVFCPGRGGPSVPNAARACRALGIPLETVPFSGELIPLVKHAPHGYGQQMNPCIDCRMAQFRLARAHMERLGAHLLATGEVVGQRPMSQRRDAMRQIDRGAGVEGLVLRPLSAKLLAPTLAETRGWVDRERLYAISGRSRKPQLELAERFGITDYPQAAGGCLLTDEAFANRARELLERKPSADEHDFELLKVGRHFRLPSGAKAIVGRDQGENERLRDLARDGDVVCDRDDTVGPIVLLCGATTEEDRNLAAALCVSHSKLVDKSHGYVLYHVQGSEGDATRVQVTPLDRATVDTLRV